MSDPRCSSVKMEVALNISKLNSLLASRDFGRVLQELRDPSNADFVRRSALEIIPEIGSTLVGREDGVDLEGVDFCLEAFKILARSGPAKEALMGFLEQLECLPSDVRFHVLLYPMQAALLRLPQKRGQSLEWVLSSICSCIKALPVPQSHGLEGQERLLLDNDPVVVEIQTAIESVIDFCRPFIKEVSLWLPEGRGDDRVKRDQRRILARFVLGLLDAPLALVDLSQQESRTKSALRNVAELLVANLCELEPNFYRFAIGSSEKAVAGQEDGPSALAVATFAYLIHAEDVCKFCVPFVYSHGYTLEVHLPSVRHLLRQPQDCTVEKGLLLLDRLLRFLRAGSLGQSALDLEGYEATAQCLVDVMVFCRATEFRRLALSGFVKYVEKFDGAGRYRLLYQFSGSSKHAGVQGLLVQLFKSNVVEALRQSPPEPSFSGQSLRPMFRRVFALADGAQTDLLADCERILEALNFCRFLLLRDPPAENASGIWDCLKLLEESFLGPLQLGLDLSKAHFELELKNAKESNASGEGEMPLSVTVDGGPLPPISHQHKLAVLQNSILGLELMQSVLSIVKNILAAKKQGLKKD